MNIRDVHIYGGLALASIGGVFVSPAWTLVCVGLMLTLFGVFAPRKRG